MQNLIERSVLEKVLETYRGALLALVAEVRRLRQNQFVRASRPARATARWMGSK